MSHSQSLCGLGSSSISWQERQEVLAPNITLTFSRDFIPIKTYYKDMVGEKPCTVDAMVALGLTPAVQTTV